MKLQKGSSLIHCWRGCCLGYLVIIFILDQLIVRSAKIRLLRHFALIIMRYASCVCEDLLELNGQILIHEIAIKELQKVAKDRMEAAFFDTVSDYMDEFLIKCFRNDLSNYELAMLTRLNLQQYRF